jgi:hypothetical protein
MGATTLERWPPLRLADWSDTRDTLHLWTQIVGKIRLALAPPVNHWWHVTLYPTVRGLTTSPMPYGEGAFELRFDFVDHRLVVDTSDGQERVIALAPQTVADFYQGLMTTLRELEIDVRIWPMTVEMPTAVRLDRDRDHSSYDRAAVERWWRVMVETDKVLNQFRGRFIGKSSPVHFFWGSFDLAVTRFNGRRAPERPDADALTREAYSHEVISAGFWPGSGSVPEASFYSYAAPEPPGFKTATARPAAAMYDDGFGIFILKYEDARKTGDPGDALLQFCQSTYEAAANLAGWNRAELERR